MANVYVATLGIAMVHGTAGGTPATAFAGIKSIAGLPELNADEFETSRQDQASAIKEFAAGMADSGVLKLMLGFVKANVTTLYTNFRVLKSWKLTFVDGSTLQFDGWIKRIGKVAPNNDEVAVGVDIRVSGAHTFTAAA
jgi:hypothetical protein